jgi:hypothetical protein
VLDLIWKIDCARDGTWSATLRNDPSVVLRARDGGKIGVMTRDLTIAILQGRGKEAIEAMTGAKAA